MSLDADSDKRDVHAYVRSPVHAGDIEAASLRFGIPISDWIDLSTGISPFPYPNTDISLSSFTRMPYQQTGFNSVVAEYYGDANFLATNGSQQVISALPRCLKRLPIVLPDLGYKEHELAWCKRGVELIHYPANDRSSAETFINDLIQTGRDFHLLVINPNNPSCCVFSPSTLKSWSNQMGNDAMLIIDEAFADIDPNASVLPLQRNQNMIVLRSFGKFFGLPGLRLGFVFGNKKILETLREHIGIWDVNGPVQEIASCAFSDRTWQQSIRRELGDAAIKNQMMWQPLMQQLKENGQLISEARQTLFSSYTLLAATAKRLYNQFASQGVLLRLVEIDSERAIVRIGLADLNDLHRLEQLNLIIKQSMRVLRSQQASDSKVERKYG